MECTSEYTNWDLRPAAEFTAWRLAQGPHSLACSKYPYCSHFGGAFYNPIPPWLRREEAKHSGLRMEWNGSRPKDGQLSLADWTPYGSSWYNYPGGTPYARIFRHPKITGKYTTQGTLSSID